MDRFQVPNYSNENQRLVPKTYNAVTAHVESYHVNTNYQTVDEMF